MYLFTKIISLEDTIGQHLVLRYSVDKLFDSIELLEDTNVVIDFQNVQTTSRSFMQRFLYRLQRSNNIYIDCINESENIIKMRDIVIKCKENL